MRNNVLKQKTLASSFTVSGNGIHSNLPVTVTVHPAAIDTGIVFRRVDLQPAVAIKACVENVAEDSVLRQTILQHAGACVKTIEHLMSALYVYGISNAVVELDQEELPALDGGASEYNTIIKETGVVEQNAERVLFTLDKPLTIANESKGAVMELLPSDELSVDYTLIHTSGNLGVQHCAITITEENYDRELSGARTFCLRDEAEMLQKAGFGKGATFQNTLVFENNKPIDNTLRYPDEAVRHKIVDLIGDFAIIGDLFRFRIIAKKTGHSENMKAIMALQEIKKQRHSAATLVAKEETMSEQINIVEIQSILPHRYPFLLVDRVLHLEPGKKAVAIKNVTINEKFFNGHFPGHPVMPGVLIVEAMAQVGGVMMLNVPENKGKIAYFMSIDNAKFRRPVVPGDQLRFEVEVVKWRTRYGQVNGKAYVDDALACEADLKFSIVEK